jgi:hypothetical protein
VRKRSERVGAGRWKPGPTTLVIGGETLGLADGLEKEGWRLTRSAGAIGRRLLRGIERQLKPQGDSRTRVP